MKRLQQITVQPDDVTARMFLPAQTGRYRITAAYIRVQLGALGGGRLPSIGVLFGGVALLYRMATGELPPLNLSESTFGVSLPNVNTAGMAGRSVFATSIPDMEMDSQFKPFIEIIGADPGDVVEELSWMIELLE